MTLAYHVVYADRAIGGLCEYYEVGEKDGVRTVNVLGTKHGRSDLVTATSGRWTFCAAGVAVCSVDLDLPATSPQRPDLRTLSRASWVG